MMDKSAHRMWARPRVRNSGAATRRWSYKMMNPNDMAAEIMTALVAIGFKQTPENLKYMTVISTGIIKHIQAAAEAQVTTSDGQYVGKVK